MFVGIINYGNNSCRLGFDNIDDPGTDDPQTATGHAGFPLLPTLFIAGIGVVGLLAVADIIVVVVVLSKKR